jgi:hypothetical protein
MGLVKAAHSSWKGSKGSDTEATELRQEFEARLAELAIHGVQADEYAGSLVFARALVEDGEYSADCLVHPRSTGSTLASTPVPLNILTRVYTCDTTAHQRDGCCATKKLRQGASEYVICRSTCEEGTNFCSVHRMFMTTNESATHDPTGRVRGISFRCGARRVWINVFQASVRLASCSAFWAWCRPRFVT